MSVFDSDPRSAVGLDAPYEATIMRVARWGPFAWHIRLTKSVMVFENSGFAWTEKRAERKAKRIIRRMEAADNRRQTSCRTIGGYQSSGRTPADLRPPTIRARTGATT